MTKNNKQENYMTFHVNQQTVPKVNTFCGENEEMETYAIRDALGRVGSGIKSSIGNIRARRRDRLGSMPPGMGVERDFDKLGSAFKLLLTIAIIICSGIIIFLWSIYGMEVVDAVNSGPALPTLSAVVFTRIGVTLLLASLLFRGWLKKPNKNFMDVPHLAGWFFMLAAIGKVLDYLIFIYEVSPSYAGVAALELAKFRYYFLIITWIPILMVGFYAVLLFFIGMDKAGNRIRENDVLYAITLVICVVWSVIFSILVSMIPDPRSSFLLLPILSLAPIAVLLVLFIFAHVKHLFPQVNTGILITGLVIYAIAHVAPLIYFAVLPEDTAAIAQEVTYLSCIVLLFFGFQSKRKI